MAEADIPISDLLQCLVECSQKAAKIAQIFRDENDLFELLVEEKSLVEKNKRFVQDFKTLADVLVQETIKKDVGEQFPSLTSNIRGEEQNSFQNSLGESISVELTASEGETAALLSKVLDGRDHIARSLASAVHSKDPTCERQLDSKSTIQANSIGIWIDPIDSTAEYIQAKSDERESHGIIPYGLQCVSVLIGAYDLQSGNAVLGVVNQPFYYKDPNTLKWDCRLYWAVHYKSENATSSTLQHEETREEKIAVLSYAEDKRLQDIIGSKYRIVHTAGAGYKSLLVACKKANLYVLSPGSTYFWDTCAPHAILSAKGGGIVKFREMASATDITNSADLQEKQLKYIGTGDKVGIESFRNVDGIIAYNDPSDVIELVRLLHENDYKLKHM